jgi:hypothetical protein
MFCSVVAGKKLDVFFSTRKAIDVHWEVVPCLERFITMGLACSSISIYVGMLLLQCSSSWQE